MSDPSDRNMLVFVCSHLRPVVRDQEDGSRWLHVMENGFAGSVCEASHHRAYIPLPRGATALVNTVRD